MFVLSDVLKSCWTFQAPLVIFIRSHSYQYTASTHTIQSAVFLKHFSHLHMQSSTRKATTKSCLLSNYRTPLWALQTSSRLLSWQQLQLLCQLESSSSVHKKNGLGPPLRTKPATNHPLQVSIYTFLLFYTSWMLDLWIVPWVAHSYDQLLMDFRSVLHI